MLISLLCLAVLPVWAAETVVIRRPERTGMAWAIALVSVALAAGLLVATRKPSNGIAAHGQAGTLDQVLWLLWLAANVAVLVWAYRCPPAGRGSGFPVVVLPAKKNVAKSDSVVGPPGIGPIECDRYGRSAVCEIGDKNGFNR